MTGDYSHRMDSVHLDLGCPSECVLPCPTVVDELKGSVAPMHRVVRWM